MLSHSCLFKWSLKKASTSCFYVNKINIAFVSVLNIFIIKFSISWGTIFSLNVSVYAMHVCSGEKCCTVNEQLLLLVDNVRLKKTEIVNRGVITVLGKPVHHCTNNCRNYTILRDLNITQGKNSVCPIK